MRRGARTWAEGLAREPTGADASTQRCCKEFTGGAGAPAGGSGWGLGASSHRPVLTEPLHPPPLPAWGDSAQAELGDPGLGRAAAGSCARGGPTGLGGHSCCEPQGRRKQGKTRRTTFWKTQVPGRGAGKTTRPAAESPGGGQGCRPGQREARAAGGRRGVGLTGTEPLSHGPRAAR